MPQRSTGHTQLQASALLDRLNAWEGIKASNPYWGRFFWQEVAGLEAQGLEPDLRRLLLSHGYIGAATVSPPTGQLRDDLVAYRDTGGPRRGAGAAASLAPLPFAELGFDKWENKLAPDLKRAGPELQEPEISRSHIGEGLAWAELRGFQAICRVDRPLEYCHQGRLCHFPRRQPSTVGGHLGY